MEAKSNQCVNGFILHFIVFPINHLGFEEAVLRVLQMLFILFRSEKILKRGAESVTAPTEGCLVEGVSQ